MSRVEYIVRVGEPGDFRDVKFTTKADADRFVEAAQEGGTYWGREERLIREAGDPE